MLKVLRKYRGPAIAIGGSLLMIAFLLPEVVRQSQGNARKFTVAEMNGRKVTAGELGDAEHEYSVLKAFDEGLISNTLGVRDGTHWFLLVKEAQAAGLVGQHENGLEWLPDIVQMIVGEQARTALQRGDFQTYQALMTEEGRKAFTARVTEAIFKAREAAAGRSGMTLDQFDLALAKARAIFDLRIGFMRAARVSDIVARNQVKQQAERAVVDVVAISADRLLSQVGEPTPDEMAAHFAQYQNSKPGTGLFGFGYVLPPRFKLEWLKLDRNALGSVVQLDPIEVSKFYAKNRDKYQGDFAVEKTNVERDLRDTKVGEIMADADRIVRSEVSRTLRKLDTEGGYKKLPADWDAQRPKFETIAAAIVDALKTTQKVTIPLPQVTIKAADWLTADTLRSIPDLAMTQVRLGSRAQSLTDLLLQCREIAGPSDIGLQVGVPFVESPITDFAGNRYYLTVLDARGEAPAASLDEVKAQVIHDLKAQKAYLKLLGEVNAQVTLAAATGVRSVADFYNAQASGDTKLTPLAPMTGVDVSATSRLAPEIDAKEFRDAVLKAASALDPLKPASDQDPLARTVTVGIPSKQTVAVAQITKLIPVTQETYRQQVEGLAMQMQMNEYRDLLQNDPTKYADPFTPEALRARFSYTERRNTEDKSKPKS